MTLLTEVDDEINNLKRKFDLEKVKRNDRSWPDIFRDFGAPFATEYVTCYQNVPDGAITMSEIYYEDEGKEWSRGRPRIVDGFVRNNFCTCPRCFDVPDRSGLTDFRVCFMRWDDFIAIWRFRWFLRKREAAILDRLWRPGGPMCNRGYDEITKILGS